MTWSKEVIALLQAAEKYAELCKLRLEPGGAIHVLDKRIAEDELLAAALRFANLEK